MRIYTNYEEVISEIKRDLIEMWQPISTYSMQNKVIEWNSDYDTKEITNYSFCLSNFDNIDNMIDYPEFEKAEKQRIDQYFKDHDYVEYLTTLAWQWIFLYKLEEIKEHWKEILQLWLNKDFEERMKPLVNPGEAWKLRPWVWEEFLHVSWKNKNEKEFDYTYSERIVPCDLMTEISKHPMSRQYVFNIWDRSDREWVNGRKRIPCSLSYQILIRPNGELNEAWEPVLAVNLIYTMRSCDFLTHFPIDIIQATKFMTFVTNQLNLNKNGKHFDIEDWKQYFVNWKLYYNCASLHLYKKDLIEDVF